MITQCEHLQQQIDGLTATIRGANDMDSRMPKWSKQIEELRARQLAMSVDEAQAEWTRDVLCRLCKPIQVVRNNDGSKAIHMQKFHPGEEPRFDPLHSVAASMARA